MRQLQFRVSTAPLLAGLLLGLAVVSLLYGCTKGGADASSPLEATPEAAIGSYVQANGNEYAGICEQTRSPEDIGQICSTLIDQRDSLQAHLIGLTFSEYTTWVFVAPRDHGWTVIATAPLDFFDTSGTIPWPR